MEAQGPPPPIDRGPPVEKNETVHFYFSQIHARFLISCITDNNNVIITLLLLSNALF